MAELEAASAFPAGAGPSLEECSVTLVEGLLFVCRLVRTEPF
jgi:hypothetical protein